VEALPFKECLRILVTGDSEHRLCAERDLMAALEKEN
jgi:hypothetical protein